MSYKRSQLTKNEACVSSDVHMVQLIFYKCVCVCVCPDPFPLVCPHSHVVDWMDFWTLGCSRKHFVTLKVMINHLHLLMSLKIDRVELKSMF